MENISSNLSVYTDGFIPTQYFHHWMLLAFAVYLLTSSHISHVNIDKAHMALCEFVLLTESLYGKQEVSYNIHLLTHLAESVEDMDLCLDVNIRL